MKLTIAIPTYNRNREFVKTLKAILSQIDKDISLLVIDNCSDIPIVDSIAESGIMLGNNVSVIRNKINIGGNANILRCFEYCDTEWLWVLGDDDIPFLNAVEIILAKISDIENTAFINFSSTQHIYNEDIVSKGVEEFLSNINYWGQINFTSISLFNSDKLKPYLRFGYQYAYSWSPHIATLLSYLAYNQSNVLFSKEKIINEISLADEANKWAPIGPNLGKISLLELPLNFKSKKILANRISKSPSLEYSVLECLSTLCYSTDKKSVYYMFNILFQRLYYFNNNPLFRLKIFFYKILFHIPKIAFGSIQFILKLRGNKLDFNKYNYDRL